MWRRCIILDSSFPSIPVPYQSTFHTSVQNSESDQHRNCSTRELNDYRGYSTHNAPCRSLRDEANEASNQHRVLNVPCMTHVLYFLRKQGKQSPCTKYEPVKKSRMISYQVQKVPPSLQVGLQKVPPVSYKYQRVRAKLPQVSSAFSFHLVSHYLRLISQSVASVYLFPTLQRLDILPHIMPINWSLYEQDAVKKYMDDRMSAKDACKWINDKYGTRISYVLFLCRLSGADISAV